MKTLIKLAWRNIWRNKKRSFISIGSVLFAVLFAITGETFNKGSYELMIKNMVKLSTGYLQIQDVLYQEEPSIDNAMLYDENIKDVLKEFEADIAYTVPRIESFVLAATDHKTRGAMLIGIDPEREARFNDIVDKISQGKFFTNKESGVVLSEGFAGIINLGVGDTLVLIGQGFQGVNASGKYPVTGIVKLAIPEMNNNTIYMPLEASQLFYAAEGRVTSLILMPKEPKETNVLAKKINDKIDKEWYRVLTWEEMLKDLLQVMQIDNAGNRIISFILYIVIGFGLLGTILTMMMERLREFAMMISIGMKRFQLGIICLLESIFISIVGCIAGIIITLPIVLYYHFNPIQLTGDTAKAMLDYGFEPIVPASTDPMIFITQAIVIFIISIIIGLYPVYKVFRLEVVSNTK